MTARLSDALLPPGLAADLPADPGIVPAFYSATDTGQVWRWDGTAWAVWALALPEGTTDGDVPVWDATAGLWVPGAGGTGSSATELLATTVYNPATAANTTAATTTGADVDATNLAVTFTAPASGSVIASLTGFADTNGGGGNYLAWCLRSGSTNVTGSVAMVAQSVAGNVLERLTHRVKITGLTPGDSYTWKWGHYCNNTASVQRTSYGGIYGQALMEIWSA